MRTRRAVKKYMWKAIDGPAHGETLALAERPGDCTRPLTAVVSWNGRVGRYWSDAATNFACWKDCA